MQSHPNITGSPKGIYRIFTSLDNILERLVLLAHRTASGIFVTDLFNFLESSLSVGGTSSAPDRPAFPPKRDTFLHPVLGLS